MNAEGLVYVGQSLKEILDNNNEVRKAGESKLNQIKSTQAGLYACYLVLVLNTRKYLFLLLTAY